MNFIKIVVFSFIALAIAACQPVGMRSMSGATQAVFGNVEPKIPKDWKRSTTPNGAIVYQCAHLNCESRGQISYSAMVFSQDAERQARLLLSTNTLQRDLPDTMYNLTNGAFQQISFTDLSNANGVSYERVIKFNLVNSSYYYIMRRSVQGQYSRIVSASAPTLSQARQYFKIALAAAK
jgi:hypothetical protein